MGLARRCDKMTANNTVATRIASSASANHPALVVNKATLHCVALNSGPVAPRCNILQGGQLRHSGYLPFAAEAASAIDVILRFLPTIYSPVLGLFGRVPLDFEEGMGAKFSQY